jgi:hypothetical protein
MPLPIGLAYDAAGHVILDPDAAIQGAVRHLLATFEATGSATAVVKAFRAAGLPFPWRHQKGPRKGEVDWQPLRHSTVLNALHNPRYAGAFTYGRHREQLLPGGKRASITVPREEWSRRLLVTTSTELDAAVAAAISGLGKPSAASGIASALQPNAQAKLPLIVASVRRDNSMASETASRSPPTRVRPDA